MRSYTLKDGEVSDPQREELREWRSVHSKGKSMSKYLERRELGASSEAAEKSGWVRQRKYVL